MGCILGKKRHRWTRRDGSSYALGRGAFKFKDDQCIHCGILRFMAEAKRRYEKVQPTVWNWLGISEKEFRKRRKRTKGCMKCGKPTTNYHNLCRGHHSAYHRWANARAKKLRESRM